MKKYDQLYLLSTKEVFGDDPGGYDTSVNDTRQLDYYKNIAKITTDSSTYSGTIKTYDENDLVWWLRSEYSFDVYAFYYAGNGWGNNFSYYGYGIAPAFRIG